MNDKDFKEFITSASSECIDPTGKNKAYAKFFKLNMLTDSDPYSIEISIIYPAPIDCADICVSEGDYATANNTGRVTTLTADKAVTVHSHRGAFLTARISQNKFVPLGRF